MKQILLIVGCLLMSLSSSGQRVLVVKKGDAEHLLETLKEANKLNAEKDAKQLYILVPDGFYDLGERVLTKITGHHIALIGQSMEGTVIQNKPAVEKEGISKTAVFLNRGTNNYFQDLTLKNALDYYACGAAGRAVCLQDKGTQTICNRVKMLSYQDTYYSDAEDCRHYFQDSEIHGTVDFICGAGDVWFERCRIVTEKRTPDGSGRNVIAAPRTSQTVWGYVFNHCTIENVVSSFEYARGWHTTPRCTWLHTILLSPEKLLPHRFDYQGMRTVMSVFKEYGTCDSQGNGVMPATNVLTYYLTTKQKEGDQEVELHQTRSDETVMTEVQAGRFTVGNVFGDWHPDRIVRQMERQSIKLMKRLQ